MINSREEGRRFGGPLFFGSILALLVGACAGGGGPNDVSPEGQPTVARPLEIYRQLGLIAGEEDYPVVASFATMAGPSDSTYVLFALSMPNSALRFQRDDDGFIGRYGVTLTFARDSQTVKRLSREETVRVRRFEETGRTDESVVFQDLVVLPAGEYTVEIEARDASSSRAIQLQDSLSVPMYGAAGARIAPPLFVYEASGRASPEAQPEMIVNPRHAAYYGAVPVQLYLEGYGLSADRSSVDVQVVNEAGEAQWQEQVRLAGDGSALRHALVDIPVGSLPLGQLWVEVSADGDTVAAHREPLLITISDQWIVANFEEVLNFLEYIATREELDSLESATGAERQRRWQAFWERRDPVPATPTNEFRDRFFERIRVATVNFGEPGDPGWQTDRGEVYIVLGPPRNVLERRIRGDDNIGRPNTIIWVYESGPRGRMELVFHDRNDFGRYELTPSSRAEFRSVADRIKRRPR